MTRAVVDPGVLVSAFLGPRGSPPDLIVRAVLAGELELVVSPKLVAELQGVLARPRFAAHSSAGRAERYVAGLVAAAAAVADPDPGQPERGLTRDPNDDYLVALARHAAADCLVSGDGDLTSLEDARPPVVTPRQLVDRFGPKPGR